MLQQQYNLKYQTYDTDYLEILPPRVKEETKNCHGSLQHRAKSKEQHVYKHINTCFVPTSATSWG